jgi:tetratricopeptide (TPR) repeat protein
MNSQLTYIRIRLFAIFLLLFISLFNGPAQSNITHNLAGINLSTNRSNSNPPLASVPILEPKFICLAANCTDFNFAEAVDSWRRALELHPDSEEINNNLAWMLASFGQVKDGAEAIQCARHACELTQYQQPTLIGTLAAAYARGEQFSNACAMAEKAITVAETRNLSRVADWNRQLLKYYQAGKPWSGQSPRLAENEVLGIYLALPFATGSLLYLFARMIRRCKSHSDWRRLALGNLLVLSFLFSFLPITGEIYYRFVYDTTDSLDFTKISNRWFSRYWQLNPSGCRDNADYFLNLKPDQRRITFVGDSFTAGHGIKDVENRFPNLLRRSHPDWEINMLAQLGNDTGDETEYLKECLDQGYKLDQVVLVYCLNDVSDLFWQWGQTIDSIEAEVNSAGWLRRNSYLVNTLYYRLLMSQNPDLKNYFKFVRDGYDGQLWEQQSDRLKSFRDLVQSHGGRLLVVTFPFVGSIGPGYEYQSAHDRLDKFWRELKVPHLNLLPVYQGMSAKKLVVSVRDPHPNELANRLAVKAIEEFLVGQMDSNSIPH